MRYHTCMVIQVIGIVFLLVLAVSVLSIAGSIGSITETYQALPLKPGDIVWIRSFGVESRCVVREVAGGPSPNVVVVDHIPV